MARVSRDAPTTMFLIRRPSRQLVERFARESLSLHLSYEPVGIAGNPPEGYDLDETIVALGHGKAVFERAKGALISWQHFAFDWVEIFPRAPSLASGTVIAVVIHHLGFWSLNGGRVLYGVGDRLHGPTFGFAYGTLTNHAEQGEEVFEVSLRPATGEVTYRIRAASRPRAAMARLGYPVVRALQARFRRDSGEAMRRAVGSSLHMP